MTPMSGSGLVIAIVDDEDCVRKALERLLHSAGFRIACFRSGEEFLESLELCQPDCTILDLHLPGLSGLEIQQYLSRNGIGLPCVVMTGRDEPGTKEQVLASGANGYLTKPFDQRALLKIICAAVHVSHKDAPEYLQRLLPSLRETNRNSGSGELHSTKMGRMQRACSIKNANADEIVFNSV
jgi:FixJ family two-component response regulator